jgi:hypothetical protein
VDQNRQAIKEHELLAAGAALLGLGWLPHASAKACCGQYDRYFHPDLRLYRSSDS